jgi:hypothetical protein
MIAYILAKYNMLILYKFRDIKLKSIELDRSGPEKNNNYNRKVEEGNG